MEAEARVPVNGTTVAPAGGAPLLEMRIEVRLDRVSAIREFLEHYLATIPTLASDADLVSRLGVAAHELLENAAKYSEEPYASLRLGTSGGPPNSRAWVEVGNLGRPEHIDDLKMTVDELMDEASAVEMYQVDMICSALKGDASGLGLARIRAELEMRVDLEVSGRTVKLVASIPGGNP